MNMNILSPPLYFHFHPLRVFFPSIPLFFAPLALLLSFLHVCSFVLTTAHLRFLSSFLVSRSPGKGSYGSPHLLNTLLVLLPLHDWCCQPTLSLLHSFSLSAGSLTQGWIDVACGCYFSRPPGRQLIGAHHCDMQCKNKLLQSTAELTGQKPQNSHSLHLYESVIIYPCYNFIPISKVKCKIFMISYFRDSDQDRGQNLLCHIFIREFHCIYNFEELH